LPKREFRDKPTSKGALSAEVAMGLSPSGFLVLCYNPFRSSSGSFYSSPFSAQQPIALMLMGVRVRSKFKCGVAKS